MTDVHPRPALLLDLDGTLADSLPAAERAYHRFLQDLGATSSPAEFERLMGPPIPWVVSALRDRHQLPQPIDELERRYETALDEAFDQIPLMDGAQDLVRTAVAEGVLLALVTSGSRPRTIGLMRQHDLLRSFDCIVTADDVNAGKPDPEPYRLALARLGADLDVALAVDDSPAGVLSARRAGLRVIHLVRPGAREHVAAGATRMDSLRAVTQEVRRMARATRRSSAVPDGALSQKQHAPAELVGPEGTPHVPGTTRHPR